MSRAYAPNDSCGQCADAAWASRWRPEKYSSPGARRSIQGVKAVDGSLGERIRGSIKTARTSVPKLKSISGRQGYIYCERKGRDSGATVVRNQELRGSAAKARQVRAI